MTEPTLVAGPAPAAMQVLVVPGLHGSCPAHWQSRWEQRHPHFTRVEQADWHRPDLPAWAATLRAAIARAKAPVVLVAHSFGCLTSVYQASLQPDGIAAALLVAPADPARFGIADQLPQNRLPFPSVLVASRNDPWLAFDAACIWGRRWGSRLVDGGALGHINAESGLGDWPQGQAWLAELMQETSPVAAG